MKTALITGITGQDGAYLSELLINKGYEVIGITRSLNSANLEKLEKLGIKNKIKLLECDLMDISAVMRLISEIKPAEIYNLAAQSSVQMSFKQPIGTMQFNITSVLNFLECIKAIDKNIRFYQASSSDMFGKASTLPITEATAIYPLSPYAISKAAAHWSVINYRDAYDLFACCGILFNHESPLRSKGFFVKKVIEEALNIKRGKQEVISVGNIELKRDFGYSKDYVNAMWLMLQQDRPQDFIICSGKSVQLKDIIYYVFDKLDISREKIVVDKNLFRPTDIEDIYGDNSKAAAYLNWHSDKTIFDVLDLMIEDEIKG